jgi:HK97 family phage prohead protease
MEHMTVKAATAVSTEQGQFEAVISTASVDREGDVVAPAAMVSALRAWAAMPKLIPLSYNHSTDAEDIVGHVDPASVVQSGDEVIASGWVDRDTERGREVWRLMKSGTLGFSFGYLIPDGGSNDRKGGGRHITQLDVFEVTATPTPMNNDTRVVSTKAIDERDRHREEAKRWMLDLLAAPAESKAVKRPRERSRGPVQVKTFEVG